MIYFIGCQSKVHGHDSLMWTNGGVNKHTVHGTSTYVPGHRWWNEDIGSGMRTLVQQHCHVLWRGERTRDTLACLYLLPFHSA